jgi:phosphatidylserine decarboxylase
MIYDRTAQCLKAQEEYGRGMVSFLYETVPGRILLRLAVSPWLSRLWGWYQKSPLSGSAIRPFIQKYDVQVTEAEISGFSSFNDFFTRRKTVIPQTDDPRALLAVADSKMRFYPITQDLKLKIKHCVYDLGDILEDGDLAAAYQGGTCIVFRLGVEDYHRYHFPDDGTLLWRKQIKGLLHTVRPISGKYRVFARNTRQVSLLDTARFGRIVQVEVGALLVGKIRNHTIHTFSRMEEKGYFEFGGSTILLLLNRPVQFDEDIATMNKAGAEIQVRAGERIGILC